jgi:hypothetical protein
MKRLDYFLAAMKAGLYRNRNWVISAFAITQEGPEDYKKDPYPYRLVKSPSGVFFVNPENTAELLPLEEVPPNTPPFAKQDKVALTAGQIPNLQADITTSYGNILANYILLVWPFKDKIPFVEGRMTPSKLEAIILPLLEDDPTSQQDYEARIAKKPNIIFVNQYLKFANAMTFISGFANLWVSGGTKKALLPPPGLAELRDSLLKKHGIDPANPNTDPTKVAMIMKELVALDAEWLAGDDTMNFLLLKKNFEVIRAKKYLMVGAEAGLGDGQQVEVISNSLHEGWNIDSMPAMVNNLRAGSFNRGAETMKGGESVKWLLRASSNINILPGDCGSQMGVDVLMTEKLAKKYMGFTLLAGNGANVVLDESNAGNYLGTLVKARSPMYCKFDHTDYCATCVGPRLADNPTGASSAISDFGSTMMLMFMKAVHGKALILAKYNFKARIA